MMKSRAAWLVPEVRSLDETGSSAH